MPTTITHTIKDALANIFYVLLPCVYLTKPINLYCK